MFKNRQGLQGHLTSKHRMAASPSSSAQSPLGRPRDVKHDILGDLEAEVKEARLRRELERLTKGGDGDDEMSKLLKLAQMRMLNDMTAHRTDESPAIRVLQDEVRALRDDLKEAKSSNDGGWSLLKVWLQGRQDVKRLRVIHETAVAEASLIAARWDYLERLRLRLEGLHWTVHMLVLMEPEIKGQARQAMGRIFTEQRHLLEVNNLQMQMCRAALKHGGEASKLSIRAREAVEKSNEEVEALVMETERLISEASKLAGVRPLPVHLIRPSRLGRLLELLERLAAGYAREKVQ